MATEQNTEDADRLREIAVWLDRMDAKRGGDVSNVMQEDLRRIALNIEIGVYCQHR